MTNQLADNSTDQATAEPAQTQPDDAAAARAVKRGGGLVAAVIVLSLIWYLAADRFTPYTSQARIEGYVVGVAPKVAGLVTQVWVSNNQRVAEGDRLFEIEPSQYQIAVDRARSDLENTERQVSAGDASVEAARAKLRAAQANQLKTEQDFSRLTRLYDDDPGTISVRRLEVSKANVDQARAQVSAAEADVRRAIEQMGGEVDNNTLLKTALTGVEKAELDLANTIVRASTDGIITNLRAEVGQFAGTGNPVLTLVAVDDVWVNAEFTENNLGHVRVGTPVEILFDVLPGEVFTGQVRSIGIGVSAGREPQPGTLPTVQNSRDWLRQSQRFPVLIGFDPAQHPALRAQLRLGGQASVIVYTSGHGFLGWLGRLFIRLNSLLSYAY